jgi:hypothetical protein
MGVTCQYSKKTFVSRITLTLSPISLWAHYRTKRTFIIVCIIQIKIILTFSQISKRGAGKRISLDPLTYENTQCYTVNLGQFSEIISRG